MARTKTPTRKGRILSIQIKKCLDTDPDISWIGEYTNDSDPWNVIAIGEHAGTFVNDLPEDAELPNRGRLYCYFRPYAGGEEPGTEDYQKYAMQDYKHMTAYNNQSWYMMGIIAVAKITLPDSDVIQKITSGGLWGIESNSDDAFIKETQNEQIDELKDELETIGFGKRAIAQAIKNIEYVDE